MLRYSSYKDDWVLEPNSSEYGSDNSSAAENQQERLIKIGWITGYVDGEGCFSINFIRQPHRQNRRGHKTGFQVAHEFAVTQGASSVDSLHLTNRNYQNPQRLHARHRFTSVKI